jgi:hypothetical protein
MMMLLDEYSRQSLAIQVERQITAVQPGWLRDNQIKAI